MNDGLDSNDSYFYEQVVGKIAGLIGHQTMRNVLQRDRLTLTAPLERLASAKEAG